MTNRIYYRVVTPLGDATKVAGRLLDRYGFEVARFATERDGMTDSRLGVGYFFFTPPLAKDTEITGLVKADVWAELTSAKDATLVAVVSDVDPSSGQSNQVTAGFLLASQRALDPSKETFGPGGLLIRPYHPFTRASQQPVVPNEVNEYQIEIYPTSQVFKKGHEIRLTIGTADTPATSTPLPDLVNEMGTITLLHGPAYPSNVLLPVIGREKPKAAGKSAKARKRKRTASRRR